MPVDVTWEVQLELGEKQPTMTHLGLSRTPKSSIRMGFSLINYPAIGVLIYGNSHWNNYLYLILASSAPSDHKMFLIVAAAPRGLATWLSLSYVHCMEPHDRLTG